MPQRGYMRILSFSPFGYEGALVSVEVDLRRGIPAVDLVGLADGAVKESRERMRSAIRNSGFEFPLERVLISLSPADLRKEGAGFDLAIALAVLSEKEKSEGASYGDEDILVMGELELNGNLRPVRGIQAAVTTAAECGIKKCIVPSANFNEACEVHGMSVFGAATLAQAFHALSDAGVFSNGESSLPDSSMPAGSEEICGVFFPPESGDFNFLAVKNQRQLLRGLQLAAAGGHNAIAFGPPGCGKTLCMQHFPDLQPLLSLDEARSVTRIYSIAGLLSPGQPVVRRAPFRQPHQTASLEGMCGGGVHCSPGEISLSHNGALFLDEGAEFKSSVLQMLRVPLESGSVTLSRAGRSTVYPADFQLLIAMNPCPCGFYGSKDKVCLCSARSVEMYWKKISGPLLDRIDLRINVSSGSGESSFSTHELRTGIAKAVAVQRKRQGKRNVKLTPAEINEYCVLSDAARRMLDASAEKNGFSPRAVSGCLRLSRTIADMAGLDIIDETCMAEAVAFRKTEGGLDLGFGSW